MTQRGGGSFSVSESGELTQVEKPTRDHPEGNRPRNSDGKPIDLAAPALDSQPVDAPPVPPRGGPRRFSTVKE
jgi:hypothetical protein